MSRDSFRSFISKMSKVSTLKENVRSISTFMQAIGASRRVSFLHEKEPVRGTVGIGEESFKNKFVGVVRPLFMTEEVAVGPAFLT